MAQPFHFRPARPYAPAHSHGAASSSSRRSPAPGPSSESSAPHAQRAAGHHPPQAMAQGGYAHGQAQGQQGGEAGMTYPMNGYGGGYYAYQAPAFGQGYEGPNAAGPSSGTMNGIVYPAVSPGPGGFDYGAAPAGGSANSPGSAGPSRYQYNPYYQQYYPPAPYGAPQQYYSPNPYPVYQPGVPFNQNQYQHPQHLPQQPYGYAYQPPYMPSHGPGPGGGGGGGYQGGPGMGYPPYIPQQQPQHVYPNGMSQSSYPSSTQANPSEASGPTGGMSSATSTMDASGHQTPNSVHPGLPTEQVANGKPLPTEPVPPPPAEQSIPLPAGTAQPPKPAQAAPLRPILFGEIEVDATSAGAGPSGANGLRMGVSDDKAAPGAAKAAEAALQARAAREIEADDQESAPEVVGGPSTAQVSADVAALDESGTTEPASSVASAEVSSALDAAASIPDTTATLPAGDEKSFGEIVSAESQYKLAPSRPSVSEATPSITIRLAASLPKSVTSSKEVYIQSQGEASSSTLPERKRNKGKGRQQHNRVAFPKRLSRERRQAKVGDDLVFGERAELDPLPVEADPAARISTGASGAAPESSIPARPNSTPAGAAPAKQPEVSPAPPAKPVIKSWAALVRASAPPSPAGQSAPATPAQSTEPPSGITSPGSPPSGSAPLPSVGQASAGGTSASAPSAPSRPGGYAAAAWGGAMRQQEDLGKLLLEGLDPRITTRTGRVGNVPRGIINTGNMCFANSILQVLAYCTPFTALFDELSKRVQADLGRKTPLVEAMFMFMREFTASDANGLQPSALPHPNGTSSSNTRAGPSGTGSKREPFVPTYVYDAMRENKRFDSMRRGHQEDAEEFLGFFLETLHEELLYLHSRHISRTTRPPAPNPNASAPNGHAVNGEAEREVDRPASPSATGDDGWLEVGKKQKINVVRNTESKESAVSRIFGGKLRSVLHTPGQKDSITLEPYQPLQLDISSASVHTITDALHHLHEPETIPGVFSSSRGVNVDATKQVFVETLPPILILHFKRFLYDAVEQKVVKKGKAVGYGTEMLVPSEIMSPGRKGSAPMTYRLFGVIYHHGSSASGGHYTAAVLHHNPPTSSDPAHPSAGTTSWVHLDDETIEEVATDEVVVSKDQAIQGWNGEVGRGGRERCAYLLFYQRV